MKKIIAVAIISMGFAGSALAQTSYNGNRVPGQNSVENGSTATNPGTDSMTTRGITPVGPNDGTGGHSGADTNINCPPGTPGAGNNSAPRDAQKINPACN